MSEDEPDDSRALARDASERASLKYPFLTRESVRRGISRTSRAALAPPLLSAVPSALRWFSPSNSQQSLPKLAD